MAETISGAARRHHFEGERCVYCGVNIYDDGIWPEDCADRDPITYTTETQKEPPSDHHPPRP